MASVPFECWTEPSDALEKGVREFAVQLGKTPRGFLLARTIVRTPSWMAEIDRKGGAGWILTVHDLTSLTTSLFDALCREATILGGVQLTLG